MSNFGHKSPAIRPKPRRTAHHAIATEAPIRDKTLVIVDPSPDGYDAIADQAAFHGVQCRHFRSGHELLEKGVPPLAAVWLINCELPDMTGVALSRLLKPRLRHASVFLVADEYDMDTEIDVLSCGYAQFVCKPIDAMWLEESVPWSRVVSAQPLRCRRPISRPVVHNSLAFDDFGPETLAN